MMHYVLLPPPRLLARAPNDRSSTPGDFASKPAGLSRYRGESAELFGQRYAGWSNVTEPETLKMGRVLVRDAHAEEYRWL